MRETPEIMNMNFQELSNLIYRDNRRIKHNAYEELSSKFKTHQALDEMNNKALRNHEMATPGLDPLIEISIEHLLAVAGLLTHKIFSISI